MMKFATRSLLWLGLLVFLAAGHQRAAAQGGNLLQNPGFEEPYSNGAAANWARWHEDTGKDEGCDERYSVRPVWSGEQNPSLIVEGVRSQHIGNQFDTWRGGVVQDVNVTAGTTYRFAVTARGRTTNEQFPAPSDPGSSMRVRVGIDPNGGGNWTAGSIVWSGPISPHDTWQQVSVEATAAANKISVFVEGDFTGANQCRAHLDVWFDAAELTVAGPPPAPTSPPQPTAAPVVVQPTAVPPPTETPEPTPTAVPTDTPIPSPTPTATPSGGTICVNAFGDSNGNGLNDADEGYMAGVRFTIARGGAVVEETVSPGTSTPICVQGLPAGEYQIAQTVPDTLEMTTAGNITIPVAEGETVGLEFGSRIKPETAVTDSVAEVDTAEEAADTAVDAAAGEGALVDAEEGGFFSNLGTAGTVGVVIIGLAVLLLLGLGVMLMRQRA